MPAHEDTEQQLEHLDLSAFSGIAVSALEERVAEYMTRLASESMKSSQRHQGDTVSDADVERAAEYLTTGSSRRFFRHFGTIGGLLLGASLSNFLSMAEAGVYTTGGVLISAGLGIVGALLATIVWWQPDIAQVVSPGAPVPEAEVKGSVRVIHREPESPEDPDLIEYLLANPLSIENFQPFSREDIYERS